MTDKNISRTAVRFSVPFSRTCALLTSLCIIESDLEVIDIYRDVLHTCLIVHFVFLPSFSWDQCHDSLAHYCELIEFPLEDVHESVIDPQS